MSSIYDVEWKAEPKDTDKYRQVLNQYLDDFLKEKKDRPMDEIFEVLLNGDNPEFSKEGENHYSSLFVRNDLWEDLLADAFFATVPYLEDESKILIGMARYDRNLFVRDGRCIDSNDVDARWLEESDIPDVKAMDQLSGYNVLDVLEHGEEELCCGLFFENELLGYCTLTSAEVLRATVEAEEDDLLLSNIFVKEEWRHMGLASILIREITDFLDDDCYIKCPDKDIMNFFLFFDFEKIKNAENIMVKYA